MTTTTMKISKFHSLSDSYVTFTNNSRPNLNTEDHNEGGNPRREAQEKGPSLQRNNNNTRNPLPFNPNITRTATTNPATRQQHHQNNENKLKSWLLLKRCSESKENVHNVTKTGNSEVSVIGTGPSPSLQNNLRAHSLSIKSKILTESKLKPFEKQNITASQNETIETEKLKEKRQEHQQLLRLRLVKRLPSSSSESDAGNTNNKNVNNSQRIRWNTVEYWNFCSPNNTEDDDDNSNSDNSLSFNYTKSRNKKSSVNHHSKSNKFFPTKYPRLSTKGKKVDNNKILRNLFDNYFKSHSHSSSSSSSSSSASTKSDVPTVSARDNDKKLSINNHNIDINGDAHYNNNCSFPNKFADIDKISHSDTHCEAENGNNVKSCESPNQPFKSQCSYKNNNSILRNHEDEFESSKLSVRQREALMGRRRGVLRTMSENSEFYSSHNKDSELVDEDVEIEENTNTSRHFNASQKLLLTKKFSYEYNFEKKQRKEDLELVSTSIIAVQNKDPDQTSTASVDMDDNQRSQIPSTSAVPIKGPGVKNIEPMKRISLSSDDEKSLSVREDDTSSSYSTAEEDYLESDIDPVTGSAYNTPVGSLSSSRLSLASGSSHRRSQRRSQSGTRNSIKRSRPSSMYGNNENKQNITVKKTESDTEPEFGNDPENKGLEGRVPRRDSEDIVNKVSSDSNLKKQITKQNQSSASVYDPNPIQNSNQNKSAVALTAASATSANKSKTESSVVPVSIINEKNSPDNLITSKAQALLTDEQNVSVKDLQSVFDCFKEEEVSRANCEILLDSLATAQSREDFQWALHQLGGFNVLLVLYARVVEICSDDEIQAKSLNLVLVQLRNHARLTDGPAHRQYHLIRFVLNSERSCFGFKTFIQIMNFCLSASGLKLLDYQLLDTCILSSWQILTRIRCTESDAPTGPKTLLECLFTIVLDLLEERNLHREFNVALLKANRFTESLLAICYHMVVDTKTNSGLNVMDAIRLGALVKSILAEMMAPPDAYVAVTLVKYGLCPLLPKELPPLPRKEDAFFIVQNPGKCSSSLFNNLRNIREAEEANEGDRIGQASSPIPSDKDTDQDKEKGQGGAVGQDSTPESESTKLMKESNEREFNVEKDDVPEIVGIQNSMEVRYNAKILSDLEESRQNGFAETFQESLLEGVMSILLNTLSIIPDGAFNSVLNPHLNAYLLVAYCSHSSIQLKKLALKLLSAYLTRVKNPVIVEFLKCKGFYLTSLYIQGNPEVSQLAINICSGFGPLSYPLLISLLYSNTIVNKIIEWVQADEAGKIPALMSMGLLPSIFNIQASSMYSLQKPLQSLLSIVTRFCALHVKDDPWKILFCPAVESSYGRSLLIPRLIQEATEALRKNKRKDLLKKADSALRLMWLMERGAGSRMGHYFDRWLLNIFTIHIMEMDEEDETENWIFFVKKNRKKLMHLMGIFLCRVFAANRDNLEFKHYTVRVLLSFCPNLSKWLSKVIKHDEQIERCFTAFVRIFLSYAEQRSCVKLDSHLRTPSFQSLISDNGNLTITLQMAAALPSLQNTNLPSHSRFRSSSESTKYMATSPSRKSSVTPSENGDYTNMVASSGTSTACGSEAEYSDGDQPGEIQVSDKILRSKFENVLVDSGILSPTSNYSVFSADFRNFKLLMDTTSTSGVSPFELRQCVGMVDKMRAPFTLSSNHRLHGGFSGAGTSLNGSGIAGGKMIASTEAYFEGIFENVHKYAMEMLISVARTRTQQEVEVARRICVQDEDIHTLKQWINIMEQMRHPKAPWHFPEAYPSFSALDQSEGPGRVRIRLKREHLRMHNRFVMQKYSKSDPGPPAQPLEYLFVSHSAELLKHPFILNEIQYMRFCTRIIPGEELHGEVILSQDHLTFIAEQANFQSENVEVRKICIKNLLKRRYTLEDRAVEVFLECRSFLFVFKNKKDRDEFVTVLAIKPCTNNNGGNCTSVNSTLLETSVTSMTSQWLKGQLSNFEYLMYLNTAAGRTYCDLMQYPVFPFVLSKYDSPTLDLLAPQSYRDLKKPMAIQDPSKEDHFISTYNYLKRECDSAPFHYGSHYSNSGIVLHFLVRLPPYTQHFLKYQDGSFDIPDRSFHSVETTWRLASKESNTDFKEAIPEFFYLPEFLQNIQHFDLGVRQNGLRVDDVLLPPWAKADARLFTLVNRQALECNHVRKFLCDWIDLIFGYKQEGKAALQALNVFHPSTYEGFEVDGNGDELLIRARKAMVSTYGQTPKQLFTYPHPRATTVPEEKCEMEVLDTVWGLRWGNFIGSPVCPDLEVIHTREYSESIKLFETKSRVVFWPENTVILGDAVVGYWDTNSVRIKSTNVFYSIGDDITCCVGTTTWIWVGHQSGRISVLKLSTKLDTVIEKVELVGHYKPVKRIDVNLQFSTAISCSGENYAILWDINKYPKVAFNNAIECPEPVDDIYSSRSTGDVVLVSKQSNKVTLATINGTVVGIVELDECLESACLSAMDPGRNVNVIAVGCDNGIIRFYSTYDMKFLNQLKVLPLASLSIKSIRYSKDGRRLYCMSQTEEGAVTVALQLS